MEKRVPKLFKENDRTESADDIKWKITTVDDHRGYVSDYPCTLDGRRDIELHECAFQL